MNRPYTPGQSLAWLDPVPDGVRVYRATVLDIQPATDPDHWSITTDRGHAIVDQTGNSGRVLPIDTDIAKELWARNDGYLVHPTLSDHHRTVERDIYDLGLNSDLGDDLDFS